MFTLQWLLIAIVLCVSFTLAIFKHYYMPSHNAPPPPAPPKPPIPASSAPKVSIETFCGHLRDYEGKPGDLNYMLNNPLDCRPSPVGYLPKYGVVEIIDTDTDPRYPYHKGKFAKFSTYDLGWEYGIAMIHGIATNHPQWTILDLMAHFAPTSDGNAPVAYADWLAARCGVIPTITLAELFSA